MTTSLVSCIMPTYNRRPFVPLAIELFLRQDYPNRELVILDDGTDPVGDLIPDHPLIRYERLRTRLALGPKRNLACERASGELIAHWDDDDWYAPHRLSAQVSALQAAGADVCGLSSLLFYDPLTGSAWRYRYPSQSARPWVAGSSLLFRRAFWEQNRFDAVRTGEDTRFLWQSRSRNVASLDDENLLVATVHRRNTSRKNTRGSRWSQVSEDEVLAVLGDDVGALRAVAEGRLEWSLSRQANSEPTSRPSPRQILIGIQADVDPRRFAATLASLEAHTPESHELLLVGGGPTDAVRGAIVDARLPYTITDAPVGGAGAFNRLVQHALADLYILLESGARVGPRWLEHLMRALDAHPRNGLAGPSTNRAWNEQAVAPRAAAADIARVADELQQRFGPATATLDPLYSLGDFCYAVTRATVDAVGAADEGYGPGPCWEMDYNVRAERAGFRGVLAKAAYVYRAPLTARRQRLEAEYFRQSRARYRSKFCAGCPRGSRLRADHHCLGDKCHNFAPADSIQITIPFRAPLTAPPPDHRSEQLVSCVMPTANRPRLARQAVEYFLRQDYPNRELIILDDGSPGLEALLPNDDRIRYCRLDSRLGLGAKRNMAVGEAAGEIIAQWDDDDWYANDRLSRQVAPLLDGSADVTGIRGGLFFDINAWQFLACSRHAHRRMFAHDVIGGTLVYRRSVLASADYPDRRVAEDASFLNQAIRSGARLHRVENNNVFVYIRHGRNTWAFQPGHYLGAAHWSTFDPTFFPDGDLAFYSELGDSFALHHRIEVG
jgi:glycosyltransferase involved in cell wall biosynthesis